MSGRSWFHPVEGPRCLSLGTSHSPKANRVDAAIKTDLTTVIVPPDHNRGVADPPDGRRQVGALRVFRCQEAETIEVLGGVRAHEWKRARARPQSRVDGIVTVMSSSKQSKVGV